jgi:outer membrane protein assembly factor BamD (BamD/ComL family)
LGEALRIADQYRTDYPNGELAPEAEVVAIEALAARGDQPALAARAARFLARYPSDPHAARVGWLAR